MGYKLIACKSEKDLAKNVMSRFMHSIDAQNLTSLIISGGSSLLSFYKQIIKDSPNLSKLTFILSDERLSANLKEDTNHYLIIDKFISNMRIDKRPKFIYPYFGKSNEKKELFNNFINCLPKNINHLMLGVGEDGHVASIFSSDLSSKNEEYLPLIFTKKTGEIFERVSFNLEFLINIKFKMFVIEGKGKKDILEHLIDNKIDNNSIPFFRLLNNSPNEILILYNEGLLK